jgi:hypothetical protein
MLSARPHDPGAFMRTPFLLLIIVAISIATTAATRAESRVFIISGNTDGYGIDRCLATGANCGKAMAAAYCRAQDFADALSFRRVEREEITGAVPASAPVCRGTGCTDLIAIECRR